MPDVESSALGLLAFTAFPATVYADPPSGPALSVSRETNRGPKGAAKVPTEPQNLAPKLSKSLVNNPLRVNKPVAFGPRREPLQWVPSRL